MMQESLAFIREALIRMRDLDTETATRLVQTGQLFEGYHPEMEKVHVSNAKGLEKIMTRIGWPDKEKVGEEANEAAWLIAQHAISLPEFQRKCFIYISILANTGLEDKKHAAYLYDRICFNERRPQKYGTQFDWDEGGELSPWLIEDMEQVNRLRKEIGLNSIEEQTSIIREEAKQRKERAPADYLQRQKDIRAWSKTTGWIRE